jgi:tRNA(Ile)-lysidine synthase
VLKRAANRNGLDGVALFEPLKGFARIGLAVSGGPDSLGLMLLFSGWSRAEGKEAFVYTVDHELRPEAAAEAEMVRAEAERLGLCCRVLTWAGEKPETGIQAAARTARYRLIGEAMRNDRVDVLVTAHHREDQAETVLMRMAHGSGVAGLAGMPLFGEVEGIRVCRPLLGVDPRLVREVVRDAGLRPADDPSNHDDSYERVRWRTLMPALADEGLDAERFGVFARRMARADAALTLMADEAVAELATVDAFGVVSFRAKDFFALPTEIGLRVLDRAVTWAGGGRDRYRLAPLEAVWVALEGSAPGHASTLGGAAILRTVETVEVFREFGRMRVAPEPLFSGGYLSWDGRFTISCGDGLPNGVFVEAAGEVVTRAAVEAFAGPVAAPMRAMAAAPVIRDAAGRLLAVGTIVAPGSGSAVGHTFNTKPSRTGQNPANRAKR